ncbi:MAG: response regulator [Tannerellaceae bacterium]|jgi:signal transduction histidine kinase/ligand-binding sensor domain-containing protein/DNA-binding response OmpR family regulator|nr:response regulator [Tannerellaceae bacterium]
MKKQIPLLLLFFASVATLTQARSSRLYGESGDMSCTLINDICQDARGFVWIATEYGLNKFDGAGFLQYLHREGDTSSLEGNNVRRLVADDDARTLWVASSIGLQRLDAETETFRSVRFSDASKPHVTDVKKLPSGNLWISTSGRGLYELKAGEWEASPISEINELFEQDFFNPIYRDSRHDVWMGVNDYGLLRMDPLTREVRVFSEFQSPGSMISDMVEDHNRQLYVSTATDIYLFDRATERFLLIPGKEKLLIRRMMPARNGNIYIGTDGQGLQCLDVEKQEIYPVENESLPFNFHTARIHALMQDRDGNLWMGCFQKGLLVTPNKPTQFSFRSLSGKEYRLGGAVTSICRDHQGQVWCSIDNEGIFLLDNRGKLLRHYPEPQATVRIFEDSRHTLWVGTYDRKLAQMDRITGQCRYLAAMPDGYIKVIAEDRNQTLYFSTFGAGFLRYHIPSGRWDRTEMGNLPSDTGSVTNRWINALICAGDGRMWFGHYTGVSCFDPSLGRFVRTGAERALAHQICLSLMEDRRGCIWIGTYNGIFCLNPQTGDIRQYTTAQGLSSDVICALAEDEDGNVWCSTFQGINQIKVEEDRIIPYYTGNGLVDKTYNRGVYFRGSEGMIYFGGNTGVTFFSGGDITPENREREILLTNLYLHNRRVDIHTFSGGRPVLSGSLFATERFRLSYEHNTFTLEFSTMDYGDPENISWEYRLRELSQAWSFTQPGVNRITYNHLPPGKYTLEVRASQYGSSSPSRQFLLQILPPWWRSRPAWMVYFALCLGLAFLVAYLVNKNRKELISEAKLRFFIDISHEIRSPVTLLIGPLEKLLKESHDAATKRTLERMHRNARRILGLINQLLDIRKIDKGQMILRCSETDMVGFIEELFDVFEDQAVRRNIKFTFERHMQQLPVWIDRNNFDKILMNLLSNAFTYTPNDGAITILLTSGIDDGVWGPLRHYAQIRIIDTGTGLDEDKLTKIFTRFYQAPNEPTFGTMGSGIGLNLSRTLIELHQGVLHAHNRKDAQGSCFSIRIPLGNAHLRKENLAAAPPVFRPALRQAEAAQSPTPDKKPVRSKTNDKILIIDDEDEIRDFLHQELKGTYKVLTARDGNEGLQITLSQMPHLILVDVVMPQMDGLTFLKKLRGNANISHIPIILLSSRAEHEDRMEGLDKGADAYLSKPFHMEELLLLITNLINTRRILRGKFSGAQEGRQKIKPQDIKSADELLMERITDIVHKNLHRPELNVSMLATEAALSRAQLHRKLKELTGISAGDFIRNIRLRQAAEFLATRKMNVSQVAYATGFANQTHFSTTFKKFYGITPVEYMRNI